MTPHPIRLALLLLLALPVLGCGGSGGKDDVESVCEDFCERAAVCAGVDPDDFDDDEIEEILDECEDDCVDSLDDSDEISEDCEDASVDFFDCLVELSCGDFEDALERFETGDIGRECDDELDNVIDECVEDAFFCEDGFLIDRDFVCNGDCECSECEDEDDDLCGEEADGPAGVAGAARASSRFQP